MSAAHVRPRVLVVDDDPGNRMLCSVNLRHAGMEVLEAEDGRQGLERALQDRPDAIVLDVNAGTHPDRVKEKPMSVQEVPTPDPAPNTDADGTTDPPETVHESTRPPVVETRGARFSRKARRTRLHAYAVLAVALLVCLIALVAANTRQVKLDWVFGSTTASLVWIVLFTAVLGWLLGVVSSALFRWRTRAPRA